MTTKEIEEFIAAVAALVGGFIPDQAAPRIDSLDWLIAYWKSPDKGMGWDRSIWQNTNDSGIKT